MDLLQEFAAMMNFTYDIHLVADGQFGSLKKVTGPIYFLMAAMD